jgi:hypothetical protein
VEHRTREPMSRLGELNITTRTGKLTLMAIINGLIVVVFLILVAASVAVVGSMIVLALFDLVLSRKGASGATSKVMDEYSKPANSSNLERAFSNWRRERNVTEEG